MTFLTQIIFSSRLGRSKQIIIMFNEFFSNEGTKFFFSNSLNCNMLTDLTTKYQREWFSILLRSE